MLCSRQCLLTMIQYDNYYTVCTCDLVTALFALNVYVLFLFQAKLSCSNMKALKVIFLLLIICLWMEGGFTKEKSAKKGKKKGKQVYCPS